MFAPAAPAILKANAAWRSNLTQPDMRFYSGPVSDHFDGEHFYNPRDPASQGGMHGTGAVLKWLLTRRPASWRKWIDAPPGATPPERVDEGKIRATFVGHSSVLIQLEGLNILCDPIWSNRASPLSWIGPPRHRAPGLHFDQLPTIDLVLQSHDHYDHFDLPTLRRIGAQWQPAFAVPLGVRARLTAEGKGVARDSQIQEMDWWQSADAFDKIRVTAVPARHFSGRGLRDRNKTLWCGYVIESACGTVYFAGDTAYGSHFAAIRERFPEIRLAFLPIGAYRPQWFMGPVHVSPPDAVRAHQEVGAATSIAIHFGTFRLADDGEQEPVKELQRALDREKAAHRFWVLDAGEGRDIP
ncbi:MAG: MBL fold metallo-hydrolase [Candidatus Acidiferrales bacterium]|jgi:L-ascorbate metabolism protein UlaG (beta-lactamase superfamily)